MLKRSGSQWLRGVGALAVTSALTACDNGADSRTPQGIALAQPAPAPAEVPVAATPVSVTPPAVGETPKTDYTNVTYGDAEKVFRKGNYKDAAEMFGGYVVTHPESASGQYMLGLSAWKSGDHARAETALKKAVEFDSTNTKALTNLARVVLEQGRASEALPYIEKANDVAPDAAEVWRVLGNVQSQLGRSDEALESYRRALALNDRDAWSMNNYGLVLIQTGRYEEAVAPLARAVELMPTSAVFHNNLGVALERSGLYGSAKTAFEKAIAADSTFTKAKISLERVDMKLGGEMGEEIDLTGYARSFHEEIQSWKPLKRSDEPHC
jgi:Tfp pilus assembly protein PilF